MNARETAEYMFEKDLFSQWLGIELTEIKDNYCLIKMPVKSEMINGLGTVHGGVTFALQIRRWRFLPTIVVKLRWRSIVISISQKLQKMAMF